jgi:hypothetical protein
MDPNITRPGSRSDKRRTARLRVHLPARYVSSNLQLEGHVTDISSDGVFFCSDFLDHQGEAARVWIEVPSRNGPLELRGEVRWVNDASHASGMGLRLIDVSLEDRELLSSVAEGLLANAPEGRA